MEKRLFLTGGDAQTRLRLIVRALDGRLAGAGGFVMEADGTGCVLRPAAALAGVEGLPGQRFLDYSVWPPARDNEVFRNLGVQLLREAAWYPCAVLVELGGFETLIPQFREALDELLESGTPLLAAWKTPEEAENWRQLFGLGERFTERTQALRLALTGREDTRIVDLDRLPSDEAEALLRAWADAHA